MPLEARPREAVTAGADDAVLAARRFADYPDALREIPVRRVADGTE